MLGQLFPRRITGDQERRTLKILGSRCDSIVGLYFGR
jgi:hypothetical protein